MKARQRRWSASLRARFFGLKASLAAHLETRAERRVPPRIPHGWIPALRLHPRPAVANRRSLGGPPFFAGLACPGPLALHPASPSIAFKVHDTPWRVSRNSGRAKGPHPYQPKANALGNRRDRARGLKARSSPRRHAAMDRAFSPPAHFARES